MNLFSGLEKFGLGIKGVKIYEEETKNIPQEGQQKTIEEPKEEDFLLERTMNCRICDKPFRYKSVKNARVRRMEPDFDLRPRFQYIDTLKYDVISCPHCGYTALSKFFSTLNATQVKLIKDNICASFTPVPEINTSTVSLDQAIDWHKLSLVNALAKKGKASEKAYTCLKTAWLLRTKAEAMPQNTEEEIKAKNEVGKEEEAFYGQAYEGFQLAVNKEAFPMCGMDETTIDYLLACMSYKLKKYDVALRTLSSVILSRTVTSRMKELAIDLKEEIKAKKKSS